MTPTLYHGPEARDKAIDHSIRVGRPLQNPIGDNGLKVSDSRDIVEIASLAGVGDLPPTLVVGPLCAATPEAADALLKTLEDLTEAPLQIILWADFLSEVTGTIKSRTLLVWCPPGPSSHHPLSHLKEDAANLCEALLAEDASRILGAMEEVGDWADLLRAVCEPLAHQLGNPNSVAIWMSIREVLDGRGSLLTAIDALLPRKM